MTLTRKQVLSVLNYHPETGTFTWKGSGSGRNASGEAGSDEGNSWRIWVMGKPYTRAKLVWLVETGKWPKNSLCRIDQDALNDRFSNLLEFVKTKPIKTREQLLSYFDYHPDAGSFTWKVVSSNHVRIGDDVGRSVGDTWRIAIAGKQHSRARLVWLAETGKWPKHEMDHMNGNPIDDRFCNLRDLTRAKIRQNQSMVQVGKFMKGVIQTKSGKFKTAIQVSGKKIHSKSFDTELEAHIEWLHLKEKHHPYQTERVNSDDA